MSEIVPGTSKYARNFNHYYQTTDAGLLRHPRFCVGPRRNGRSGLLFHERWRRFACRLLSL